MMKLITVVSTVCRWNMSSVAVGPLLLLPLPTFAIIGPPRLFAPVSWHGSTGRGVDMRQYERLRPAAACCGRSGGADGRAPDQEAGGITTARAGGSGSAPGVQAVAVADHAPAPAPVRQALGFHRGEKGLGFRLDPLRQQPACAAAQDRGERIVDRVGLTQGNNGARTRHGVSLLREDLACLHLPRYAALLNQPSPRCGHSSRKA